MNEQPTAEQIKIASKAYCRGFVNHTIVGLGKTPEVAVQLCKRANNIMAMQQAKYASIVQLLRAHIQKPA